MDQGIDQKIEAWWHGKTVKQVGGIKELVGREGTVNETFRDEKGALHCLVGAPKLVSSCGEFWCPVSLLEKTE